MADLVPVRTSRRLLRSGSEDTSRDGRKSLSTRTSEWAKILKIKSSEGSDKDCRMLLIFGSMAIATRK